MLKVWIFTIACGWGWQFQPQPAIQPPSQITINRGSETETLTCFDGGSNCYSDHSIPSHIIPPPDRQELDNTIRQLSPWRNR